MTARFEIYKCEVCGNMVEVLNANSGILTCCAQKMTHLQENTTDAAVEKHVPVPYREENGAIKVSVGEVPHPMIEEHYIQWIEICVGNHVQRKYLNPGDDPAAIFHNFEENSTKERPVFREYCNLHGLWKSEG
ncbi:MAG: desulfoferrodoxin [Planctomycetia bacterium]|nr:desulfoferrodoxin [Planctomycetia bacterium]